MPPMHILTSLFSEILQLMTFVKIAVAVIMVVGLSVLAEKVSTRFAGLVSGFPLGAAISLFFIGYEVGPGFAARSAAYMVFGLTATMFFVLGYFLGTQMTRSRPGAGAALISGLAGVLFYFLGAALLHMFQVGLFTAAVCSSAAIILFTRLFSRLRNINIEKPVRLNTKIYFWRASFSASVVVLVTAAAKIVGPAWAGLLSAFPVTLLPFVVIVHATYRVDHVRAILKNVPRGMGSLVVFGIAVGLTYPAAGIWLGTLAGYAASFVYLLLVIGLADIRVLFPFGGRSREQANPLRGKTQ